MIKKNFISILNDMKNNRSSHEDPHAAILLRQLANLRVNLEDQYRDRWGKNKYNDSYFEMVDTFRSRKKADQVIFPDYLKLGW